MIGIRPFIIYALPRSRTAWLSRFLTHGQWKCGHDVITDIHTTTGLKEYFGTPYRGSAETALVEIHPLMERWFPDAAIAVIRRPIDDVKKSLSKFAIEIDGILHQQSRMLDAVSKKPTVLTVDYRDLDDLGTMQKLWRQCLATRFDTKHWQRLRNENIQIDMTARLKTLAANRVGMLSLRNELLNLLTLTGA